MTKIALFLILMFFCSGIALAEMRTYTLNQYELSDENGAVKTFPIKSDEKKPMSLKLTLAGLGTNKVTAQAPIYNLSVESQVYPLEKNNGTGVDGADWYYVRGDQGLTVIEIKGESIKLHNLGLVNYTYVGALDRSVN